MYFYIPSYPLSTINDAQPSEENYISWIFKSIQYEHSDNYLGWIFNKNQHYHFEIIVPMKSFAPDLDSQILQFHPAFIHARTRSLQLPLQSSSPHSQNFSHYALPSNCSVLSLFTMYTVGKTSSPTPFLSCCNCLCEFHSS